MKFSLHFAFFTLPVRAGTHRQAFCTLKFPGGQDKNRCYQEFDSIAPIDIKAAKSKAGG
jgi:hypothetical protein